LFARERVSSSRKVFSANNPPSPQVYLLLPETNLLYMKFQKITKGGDEKNQFNPGGG
jgi:hypothetical protein